MTIMSLLTRSISSKSTVMLSVIDHIVQTENDLTIIGLSRASVGLSFQLKIPTELI